MTEEKIAPRPSKSASASSAKMMFSLGGIATLSGILIVLAYQLTLPAIEANKAQVLQKAVYEVLPKIDTVLAYEYVNDQFVLANERSSKKTTKESAVKSKDIPLRFFVGYSQSGLSANQPAGFAIEAEGQGFADIIKFIYGYSPQSQQIIGFKVLASKETPGLGDKIEKDPNFLANFKDLDVRLNEQMSTLSQKIEVVKNGKKTKANQIDGITGATISSKAIGAIFNVNTAKALPIAQKLYKQLQSNGETP